jgi:hypothetical protein
MQCHPKQFDEWSRSMHAYASEDPVFVAMNKRGQRDTNNALGTFCVQCHAPMAVALGTTDGITYDPAALSPAEKGITCYFCHDVASIADTHNNGLQIALDQTMRGEIKHPVSNTAHHEAYDETMDPLKNDSSMCGSCHDVTTSSDVHLERTFQEWQGTIFADVDPAKHLPLTCSSGCHMAAVDDVVADDPDAHVPFRTGGRRVHSFAAVDQAMTTFPGTDVMATEVQAILDPALGVISPQKTGFGGICVPSAGNMFTVRTDNLGGGHMIPSGAAQDRRMWLEVKAFDTMGTLVFSSGVVPDGMDPPRRPVGVDTSAPPNPSSGFWWDQTYTDAAKTTPAHFFWDVVAEDSNLIRPSVTFDPTDPRFDHSTTAQFNVPSLASLDRVEVRVLMRPFAYDTLDELIASGDLDPAIRAKVPTLQLGATYVWTRATADPVGGCNPL